MLYFVRQEAASSTNGVILLLPFGWSSDRKWLSHYNHQGEWSYELRLLDVDVRLWCSQVFDRFLPVAV